MKLFRGVQNLFKTNPRPQPEANQSNSRFRNQQFENSKRSVFTQNKTRPDTQNNEYTYPALLRSESRSQGENYPTVGYSQLNLRNREYKYGSNTIPYGFLHNNYTDSGRTSSEITNLTPKKNAARPTTTSLQSFSSQSYASPQSQSETISNQPLSNRNVEQQSKHSNDHAHYSTGHDSVVHKMDRNRPSSPMNSKLKPVRFPSSRFQPFKYPLRNHRQSSSSHPISTRLPSTFQNHMSKYNFDYPIEDVFIDGDIPPSIAIKINEAVERDRFGDIHFTHRYAYQPVTQHLKFGHSQQIDRQLLSNPRLTGTRHIREIANYNDHHPKPSTRNLTHLQCVIDNTPESTCQITHVLDEYSSFPMPINHYTALALSNDPMQM